MAGIYPFSTVIAALLDESKPFPARYLDQFSDIDPDHLRQLKKVWQQIPLIRRKRLLEDLEDLLEKNTLLSFNDLAENLIKDPDAEIREIAIRLLWEVEDIERIPTLLEILNSDPSGSVSATAAGSLGFFISLGELEKIPNVLLKRVEEELLKAARENPKPLTRRRAIEALGASSRPEIHDLIVSAYASADPQWIASALYAMGRSCDQSWEKQIINRFHHSDESVRLEAIQAAGELALESARGPLLRLLEDEEQGSELEHAILWSLSQIGGEGVREKLESRLETSSDTDEDFLEEALENLNLTNDMASFTLLDVGGYEDQYDDIDGKN
jgi:HEAT repeat protein